MRWGDVPALTTDGFMKYLQEFDALFFNAQSPTSSLAISMNEGYQEIKAIRN